MKELQPDLLNDYEHLITRGIERHGEVPDFPKMEDSGIERKELDDFLFEVQSALDSQGSQKAQLTKYGIVAIVPVLIFSAFPEAMLPGGKYSLYVAIAIGLLLAFLWKGLSMLLVKHRIARIRANHDAAALYADRVEEYLKQHIQQFNQ